MTTETCEACNDLGYLEVCIGMEDDGIHDKWENQWCDDCWVITPDEDPPELKE